MPGVAPLVKYAQKAHRRSRISECHQPSQGSARANRPVVVV